MYSLKYKELESEYKFMINQDLYNQIALDFDWQDEYEQINYYYLDESHELAEENITVRVRYQNDKYKLQVKSPRKHDGPLVEKIEYESDLEFLPKKIPGYVINDCCGLQISDLYCVGSLTTFRKTCKLSSNVKICLDLSRYFNTEDYEVEVEVKSECSIRHFLDTYSLSSQSLVTKCKFARFLDKCDFSEDFVNGEYNKN